MIRNAAEKDFLGCIEIARLAWPEFKERPSIYHLFCKHFSNTCFVYENGPAIDGFLLGFLSQTKPAVAYAHLIAVDPGSQGRGIATALYRSFFDVAAKNGRSIVSCIVNPDNAVSLRFHERLGFVCDRSGDVVEDHGVWAARDYNGPGINMVRFNKSLER